MIDKTKTSVLVSILVQQFSIVLVVVHQVRTPMMNSKMNVFFTPAVLILRSGISENVDCTFTRNIHISFIGKH